MPPCRGLLFSGSLLEPSGSCSQAGRAVGQGCGAVCCPNCRGLWHGAVTPSLKTCRKLGSQPVAFLAHQDGDWSLPRGQAVDRSREFGQAGTESRCWIEHLLP